MSERYKGYAIQKSKLVLDRSDRSGLIRLIRRYSCFVEAQDPDIPFGVRDFAVESLRPSILQAIHLLYLDGHISIRAAIGGRFGDQKA